jgi:hypothetical protein
MLAKKNYPKVGFWLSVAGAAFILIQGIMFIFLISIWSTIEYGGWTGLANVILGILMVLTAMFIGSAAATMVVRPDYNVAQGSTIALVSFLALFLGGGYVIGSVLGILGGIMAILWYRKKT